MHRKKINLLIILVAVITMTTGLSIAQPNSSFSNQFSYIQDSRLAFLYSILEYGDFEDLSLEISTEAKAVIPMEPLPITITLSNKTNKSIKAITNIDPGFGLLNFYIAKDKQPFESFCSSETFFKSGPRVELAQKPNSKESVDTYLFYANPINPDKDKRGKYLFESEGIYRMKAVFADSQIGKKIESNILTVEVLEPKDENAAAYQFLKNMLDEKNKEVFYGNILLRNWTQDRPEIKEKQAEFIEKFPNSRYSRFLYFSMGIRNISRDSQEVQRGIELLEKAASCEDFLFSEDSILKLIETFMKTGQTDKAREYKEMLANRFPESSEGKHYVEEITLGIYEPVKQKKKLP